MQSLRESFIKLMCLLFLGLTMLGCSHIAVPIYERIYGDKVIREGLVGNYIKENGVLNFNESMDVKPLKLVEKSSQERLVSIIKSFEKSNIFLAENSRIQKIVWDDEHENARVQLRNCKYFIVTNASENIMEAVFLESGVMAPCG